MIDSLSIYVCPIPAATHITYTGPVLYTVESSGGSVAIQASSDQGALSYELVESLLLQSYRDFVSLNGNLLIFEPGIPPIDQLYIDVSRDCRGRFSLEENVLQCSLFLFFLGDLACGEYHG